MRALENVSDGVAAVKVMKLQPFSPEADNHTTDIPRAAAVMVNHSRTSPISNWYYHQSVEPLVVLILTIISTGYSHLNW